MPFGFDDEYDSFEECVEDNRDSKETPEKYCGWLKKKTEEEE